MKLIYIPGACSLAIHIALKKIGKPVELGHYDPSTGNVDGETPLSSLTDKPYVPTLIMPDGEVMNETAAILMSLDEMFPKAQLLPSDPMDRRVAREWLVYISSEMHKTFAPLFAPNTPEGQVIAIRERLAARFDFIANALEEKGPFLLGAAPYAPDMYLFVMTLWAGVQNISLEHWPSIVRYQSNVSSVGFVASALDAEGLLRPDMQDAV